MYTIPLLNSVTANATQQSSDLSGRTLHTVQYVLTRASGTIDLSVDVSLDGTSWHTEKTESVSTTTEGILVFEGPIKHIRAVASGTWTGSVKVLLRSE